MQLADRRRPRATSTRAALELLTGEMPSPEPPVVVVVGRRLNINPRDASCGQASSTRSPVASVRFLRADPADRFTSWRAERAARQLRRACRSSVPARHLEPPPGCGAPDAARGPARVGSAGRRSSRSPTLAGGGGRVRRRASRSRTCGCAASARPRTPRRTERPGALRGRGARRRIGGVVAERPDRRGQVTDPVGAPRAPRDATSTSPLGTTPLDTTHA